VVPSVSLPLVSLDNVPGDCTRDAHCWIMRVILGYVRDTCACRAQHATRIPNIPLAETHALLLKTTNNPALGLTWLREVAYTDFTVIRPSKTEEEEAVQLLTNHKDKLWSLVDALSFTIMEKLTIPYYFLFDEDFRQTGKFVDVTRYL
jgi:predicted nucleic acid-binding protein